MRTISYLIGIRKKQVFRLEDNNSKLKKKSRLDRRVYKLSLYN
jgi:hypothetical protein